MSEYGGTHCAICTGYFIPGQELGHKSKIVKGVKLTRWYHVECYGRHSIRWRDQKV